MPIHKIAVIADTHGSLRPKALELLRSSELILHGGDIADRKTFDRLNECARLIAVRGNCDKEWAEKLPQEVSLELYGRKIYMVHNKKQASSKAEAADLMIYGHSHRYEETEEGGKLFLNPGSGGPRRFGKPATMAVLKIDEESGSMTVERIDLSADEEQDAAADSLCPALDSGKLRGIVEEVVRDLVRGRSVDHIVKTHRISRALTEQICQIYFTHPGIDVQGVMDRIEIAGR